MRPTALLWLCALGCLPGSRVHPRAAEEVRRGYEWLGRDDFERAGIAFEHALEFNREHAEALNGLGVVQRRQARNEAARALFERALAARQDFAEAHVNLGECLVAMGRPEQGEAEFRAALAIDPDLVVARLDLARALLHRGRASPADRPRLWSAARREYLHLLESSPDLAEAHHDLAFMDYENGAFARAEAGFRRAASIDPRSIEALHGRCISLVRLGRCREAVVLCRACLEISAAPQCQRSLRGALACEP